MRRKSLMMKLGICFAALLLVGGLCACSQQGGQDSSLTSEVEDLSVFPEGASIGGKNIAGKTVDEATTIARDAIAEQVDAIEITVKFKDDTIVLTGDDFATQDVLDLTLPKLLESRLAEDTPLNYVMDLSEAGEEKLTAAAMDCVTEAKDATVSGQDENGFVFTDEQAGSRVDLAKTLESVHQLLSEKRGGDIQAAFIETQPTITKAYLQEHFVKLSSYSTVSTNTANGNSNMKLALSKVNGTVLEPGEEFSYNTTLGDSTDPNSGWLPAGGISGGVIVQMYGGGICQGSSTLYIAALNAGMEIVERWEHAIPSSYCPIGLDATVDYGNLDFRFKNPMSTPVFIAAWMDGTTLYVEFYGVFPEEWDKVVVSSEQTGSTAPLSSVTFRTDDTLASGQYVRRSSGNTGYTARAYRSYYKGDQLVKSEELSSSSYPATGMVYAVGPGTDTDKVDTTKSSGTVGADATPTPSPTATPTPTPAPPTPTPATPTPAPSTPTPTPAPPTPTPATPTPATPTPAPPTTAPPTEEPPASSEV